MLLILFGQDARADLLGETPHVYGVPPQHSSFQFYSPTPQIRFHRHALVPGPIVYGYDVFDTTGCHGQQYHVTASCRVNGVLIPWSERYYYDHPNGGCVEIFSWHDVVVDLGQPGPVTVELDAGNSVGLGEVGITPWSTWTVGEVPPPFEILYVYPNDQIYQWDGEEVRITAVTRSNWGTGSLTLTAKIRGPWEFSWTTIGVDSFTATAGQDHESTFFWYTPFGKQGRDDYDIKVELRDSQGQVVTTLSHDNSFTCTELTDQQIAEMQDDVATCWLDPGEHCGYEIASMAPGAVGALYSGALFVEEMCRAGQLHRAGRDREAWAAAISGFKDFGSVALFVKCPVPGACPNLKWLTRTDLILSAGSAALDCVNAGLATNLNAGKARSFPTGTTVDSLAAWIRTALDSSQVQIADGLFVEGTCAIRMDADSSFADTDSTGLNYADIIQVTDSISVALIASRTHRFGTGEEANPNSEAAITIRSTASQTLNIGLLHRTATDTLAFLRYPPLAVTDSTKIALRVSRPQLEFPLEVDYEGDGVVDLLWYPPGQPSAVPEQPGCAGLPASPNIRMVPNPAKGSATFFLQAGRQLSSATVEIFDTAGRKVRAVEAGNLSAGAHSVSWDGRSDAGACLPSGVYFYRLVSDQGPAHPQRMLVLR
jgi:hypothetical protein